MTIYHTRKERLSESKKKLIPQTVWTVFEKFVAEKKEIYLVGGAVRNLLEGRTPKDCDFTTNADPQTTQSFFKDSFYNNDYGMVSLPIKNRRGQKEIYEITTYRTEWGYSDRRRPDGVAWGKSLLEDLQRRDFTFNAVVIGPVLENGAWCNREVEIIDVFDGIKDLKQKIVRSVGDPRDRFAEDALRMMRAIRFAARYGFKIEEKTFAAIGENAYLIKRISGERIRDELLKTLGGAFPYEGYMFLHSSGLAKIILPEVELGFGVSQKSPKRHHIYDVGTHAVLSLKNCPSKDPISRLAALLHDVGKPATRQVESDGIVTFHNHEIVSTSIAYEIAKRLRFSKKQSKKLTTLVRWHQFTVNEKQTDKAIRRFIRRVGKENLEEMLAVRIGDRLGSGAKITSWRLEKFKARLEEVQKQPFAIGDLKIDGRDVMKALKIKPGPEVGKILKEVFQKVENGEVKNKRELLLEELKNIRPEK